MARDYLAVARQLRVKAADPAVSGEERRALLDKAAELEAKYRNSSSATTDQTTVTATDGRQGRTVTINLNHSPFWAETLRHLKENQWRWNSEYYDEDGTPRTSGPDLDDVYEEEYKYEIGEDDGESPDA